MRAIIYTLGVLALTAGLPVFSYLDRVYRELGRVTVGRIREHLEAIYDRMQPCCSDRAHFHSHREEIG